MIVHVVARTHHSQDPWYDIVLCGERVAWVDQVAAKAKVGTVYRSVAERKPELVTCEHCAARMAVDALEEC